MCLNRPQRPQAIPDFNIELMALLFGKSPEQALRAGEGIVGAPRHENGALEGQPAHLQLKGLAARYGTVWGVDIAGIPQRFSRSVIELTMGGSRYADLAVLIGCADNRAARRDIQNTVRNHPGAVFWLDCGNVKESGQVLIGRNNPEKEVKSFPVPELCAWLPLPSVQHKELVVGKDDEEEEQHQEETGMSCADIAMRDEQGLTINQAIAALAADYLVRLLLTNNLDKFQTTIDLNSGSMQSTSITPANVGKWKRR